jgi:hypothetical protein
MTIVESGARVTLKNILYLTDFSEPSEAADTQRINRNSYNLATPAISNSITSREEYQFQNWE